MTNYITSDIALAAYLMMRGVKLISADRQGGKFTFTFDDKNNLANSTSIEYLSSDFPRFDAAMRHLKKMLYRN
jgi:hypothetical protein